MNLSMFSCIHFLSNRKQPVISKRVQESPLKNGSAVTKPRPMNLVSKNLLSVKKDSSQELSDQTSPGNQELDQSGVLVRSWKLLRDTNQNPTMNCQERQEGDAQSFSTWKQGVPGNSAREGRITNSESRSFTFTTCRSPIIGTLGMSSRIYGKG